MTYKPDGETYDEWFARVKREDQNRMVESTSAIKRRDKSLSRQFGKALAYVSWVILVAYGLLMVAAIFG